MRESWYFHLIRSEWEICRKKKEALKIIFQKKMVALQVLSIEVEWEKIKVYSTLLITTTNLTTKTVVDQIKAITGIGHTPVHLSKIAIFLSTRTAVISKKNPQKPALYATILVNWLAFWNLILQCTENNDISPLMMFNIKT